LSGMARITPSLCGGNNNANNALYYHTSILAFKN
jgi:hypothetical protein